MAANSAVGVRFTAAPVDNGAAVRIELPTPELDYDAAEAVRAHLRDSVSAYLAEGIRSFVIDISAIQRIDSSGVGLLIAIHHDVVAKGGTLVLAGGTPFVRKVFRWTHVDRFLRLERSVDRALRALVDVD